MSKKDYRQFILNKAYEEFVWEREQFVAKWGCIIEKDGRLLTDSEMRNLRWSDEGEILE